MTDQKPSVKALLLSLTRTQRDQLDLIEALANALPDSPNGARVYGLEEMAARRNLSANTLRSWAKSGRLRCSSGPRKQYLTTDADVDAALAVAVPARTSLRIVDAVSDDFDALEDALSSGALVRAVS